MALFSESERPTAEALCRLLNTNPFLPDWVEGERQILGARFQEAPAVYSRQAFWAEGHLHPNVGAIGELADGLVQRAWTRLDAGGAADADWVLYEDLALYQLYGEHYDSLTEAARKVCRPREGTAPAGAEDNPLAAGVWDDFRRGFDHYFPRDRAFPSGYRPERVFAIFFQMRRAFVRIYDHIVGGSRPAARLRAAVWQSIFTHDLHRYYRSLHARMADLPTLITGASGTGKELVARAIGLSQYIPFDPRKGRFEAGFDRLFFPLNLSALAPTLIESELFGHCKGAFSGAVRDRAGWLEECDPHGAVFLDEIGEVDPAIQVKLLRVLQTRRFERLGEAKSRRFEGKLLAATNRNLADELGGDRFRLDFYYRLCADQITTPTLREQLADDPADLGNLVRFITREVLSGGDGEDEAESLAAEVVSWIEQNLGRDYPWPGNFRELGHCVRGVMIRRDFRPLPLAPERDRDEAQRLAAEVAAGSLTAADLERRYYTLVYAQSGSYQNAARRLGVDWRTVKNKVDTRGPESPEPAQETGQSRPRR
jgi:DNA-binding NtrC family response regulator